MAIVPVRGGECLAGGAAADVVHSLCALKDMHLAHHHDENLTDPYDDPESKLS